MRRTLLYIVTLNLSLIINQCSNSVGPVEKHLQKLWEISLNESSMSGFAVSDNSIIFKTVVSTTGQLYKVSIDGKRVQVVSIGGCTHGIPVVQENIIYTNTCAYSLYALKLDDLSIIWNKTDFVWIPIPNVDENYIYVTDLNRVSALDKTSGNTIWSTDIFGKNSSNPAIEGSQLYFATGSIFREDGYLYSINKYTGSIYYQIAIPYIEENAQFGGSVAGVSVWNEFIFVSGDNRIFYCFDKSSGELIWSFVADAPIWVTAKVSDNKVYFGTLNRTCYSLDAFTGTFNWSYKGGGSIMHEPSFFQNYVMFKASGALLILDKNSGKELLKLNSSTTDYGYENAFWDIDGKIYTSGFRASDQQPLLMAFQFK